jgi:hypothetical protein
MLAPPGGIGFVLKIYPTASTTDEIPDVVSQKASDSKQLRAAAGQPFCVERNKLQEFLLALLQRDARWLRELKDNCMGLPEGAKMVVIEEYPSGSEIGHVSKVRVFAPRKGSMVGYTLMVAPN